MIHQHSLCNLWYIPIYLLSTTELSLTHSVFHPATYSGQTLPITETLAALHCGLVETLLVRVTSLLFQLGLLRVNQLH